MLPSSHSLGPTLVTLLFLSLSSAAEGVPLSSKRLHLITSESQPSPPLQKRSLSLLGCFGFCSAARTSISKVQDDEALSLERTTGQRRLWSESGSAQPSDAGANVATPPSTLARPSSASHSAAPDYPATYDPPASAAQTPHLPSPAPSPSLVAARRSFSIPPLDLPPRAPAKGVLRGPHTPAEDKGKGKLALAEGGTPSPSPSLSSFHKDPPGPSLSSDLTARYGRLPRLTTLKSLSHLPMSHIVAIDFPDLPQARRLLLREGPRVHVAGTQGRRSSSESDEGRSPRRTATVRTEMETPTWERFRAHFGSGSGVSPSASVSLTASPASSRTSTPRFFDRQTSTSTTAPTPASRLAPGSTRPAQGHIPRQGSGTSTSSRASPSPTAGTLYKSDIYLRCVVDIEDFCASRRAASRVRGSDRWTAGRSQSLSPGLGAGGGGGREGGQGGGLEAGAASERLSPVDKLHLAMERYRSLPPPPPSPSPRQKRTAAPTWGGSGKMKEGTNGRSSVGSSLWQG